MADDRVRAVLSVVNDDFVDGFKQSLSAVEDFNAKLKEHMNNVGNMLSIGGGAITAFGENAMKNYGSFEAQLNKAAVVAGGTSEDIKGLSDVANEMAKDLPLDAQQAGEAMVGMAQNGAGIKQIKDYFPPIAKASTAASADIGKTAEAVQQSMNIWGGSAKRNAAILVQTANLSNASIETMGDAFSNVGTNAHSLGMSIDVTSESIGLLTNRGMSSARASMDLNHALVQMIKPSKGALGVMQQLGISYTDSSGRMKPFKQILQELNDALATYTPAQKQAALATLFGTAGEQAMLPLMEAVANKTGNASNSWDAYEKQMKKAAGTSKQAGKTLDKQASEMQKNIGSAIEQVGGSFDDLKNTAMQSQDDLLRKTLNNIADMLNNLRTSHSEIGIITRDFIGLSPIIGPVVTAAGGFIKALASIESIINPWTIFGGLLAVLAGRFIEIYNSSKPLRKAIGAIGDAFKDAFGEPVKNLLTLVKDFFESLTGKSKHASGQLSKIGSSMAKTLKKVNWKQLFVGLRTAIYDVIYIIQKLPWKQAFKTAQTAIKQVIKFIQSEWKILKKAGFQRALRQIAMALSNLAKQGLKNIRAMLPTILSSVRTLSKILAPILTTIMSLGAWLVRVVGNILKANAALMKAHPWLKKVELALGGVVLVFAKAQKIMKFVEKFRKVIWAVKDFVINLRRFIDVAKAAGTAIKAFGSLLVANPWTLVIAAIVAAVAALVVFFTKTKTGRRMWANFTKWFKNMWKGLTRWLGNLGNNMKRMFTNFWKFIQNVFNWYINAVKNYVKMQISITFGWVIANFKRWFELIKDIFTHGKYYMTHPIALAKKIIGTQISAIRDFFKRLGMINLWNAGSKVIGGFIDGLKRKWDEGKNFVGGIANWIKEHKGPIEYDAVLLEPAGNAIMAGLNKGLQNKFRDVQATIAGITDNIATSAQTMPEAFNRQLNGLAVDSRLQLQTSLQNQQIQIDRRPANINLNLGGHNYSTFVRDVTNEQSKQYDLDRRR